MLEGKVQQQQLQQGAGAPEQLDSARGTDQSISAAAFNVNGADTPRKKAAAAAGGAALQDGSGITALAGSSSSNTWDEQSKASAAGTAMELQPLARCGLVSGYVPSQGVQGTVMQLLQEAPELLLSCSSQLAAQASQELTAILDEAETALLAPLGWGSSAASAGQELSSASKAQQQGLLIAAADVAAAAAATCPYTLPWTIPWQTSISQQQQQSDKAAAFQSPEMLVKQRQQMHVQLYVQAKASAAAAAEAEVQLEQLMGAVPLLSGAAAGSWESQLAALWLRAQGLRAELAVLTQRKAEFEQDVDACIQVSLACCCSRWFMCGVGRAAVASHVLLAVRAEGQLAGVPAVAVSQMCGHTTIVAACALMQACTCLHLRYVLNGMACFAAPAG